MGRAKVKDLGAPPAFLDTPRLAKSKGGRPGEYQPGFIPIVAAMSDLGATEVQIAQALGVADLTLYRWGVEHPEFCTALKLGKKPADNRVVRSLYHRAVGYSFDAEKIHVNKDGDVTRVPYKEHVPPDTTACIFWLKNRLRGKWTDTQKIDHGGTLTLEALVSAAAAPPKLLDGPVESVDAEE